MTSQRIDWVVKCVVRLGAALTLTLITGCGRPSAKVPDDEAMANAKAEHQDPGAVRKGFYYTATEHDNFFKGMDAVAVPASPGDLPDQLLVPGTAHPATSLVDVVATPNEILGRNTWLLWCGGNERFWDWLANNSLGFMDLLKVVDSRNRANRWRDAGMVNEPGMKSSFQPDQYGLYIDAPDADYYQTAGNDHLIPPRAPHDPAYQDGSPQAKAAEHFAGIYGWSSGVVGLRLFKNPEFKGEAEAKWKRMVKDGVAADYYDKPEFYSDPKLVRPYRVGMSCAFCHVSAHPLQSPLDPAGPRWENLSGAIGAQYLRVRSVFGNLLPRSSFVYHLLDSQPPGTIDTSLIASDNINNPNTMNAIFGVPQRVQRAYANPREKLGGGSADLPSLGLPGEKPPYEQPRHVPRILLDGADSIGVYGALARVYLNIGTYSEQWTRIHTPLVGFIPPAAVQAEPGDRYQQTQAPFLLKDCQEHSIYWQATQDRVNALRDYFLKITPSMPLLSAVGGGGTAQRVRADRLAHGRQVFAANCIVCHSSVQPENNPRDLYESDPADLLHQNPPTPQVQGVLTAYTGKYRAAIQKRRARVAAYERDGELWDHDPGQWLRDPDYAAWAKDVVELPQFWKNNYLSTDFRVPATYVGTNSGRAVATNGMTGRMWQDFSSESYRNLPSVGAIPYFNPFTQQDESYTPRHRVPPGVAPGGGGPGYYRPASLISVWATAPLLHNNSLGLFNNDPSLKGRLAAFDDAIHKLLWPERRLESSSYNEATAKRLQQDHGLIWRTLDVTYLNLPAKDVPAVLSKVAVVRRLLEPVMPLLGIFSGFPWLPSLVLLVLAFLSFVAVPPRGLARGLGYALVAGALLIGFVLYFAVGGLGDVRIGPIPKGTPINLLANLNPDADPADLKAALKTTVETLADAESRHLDEAARVKLMEEKVVPALLKVSKCPDYVMDKGHYYPWFEDMSDDDKEALIELLKTF